MNHRSIHLSRWMVIVVIMALLAACAPAPAAPAAEQATAAPAVEEPTPQEQATPTESPYGGEAIRALTSEPRSLDPHGPPSSGANVILPYIFDSLVYRTPDNEFHPYLAESWAFSDDGLSLTVKLKEGIRFHDGTPLNADAVAFTFNRLKESGRASPIYSAFRSVTAIEAVDVLTVRFTFSSPNAMFITTLSQPYAGILSPKAVTEAGDAYGQHPVGTGAFRLARWDAGVQITLEANPDYAWPPPDVKNQGRPYIDRLTFKFIPDATTQLSALQAGEVDMMYLSDPAQIDLLAGDPNITLVPTVLHELIYLGFNCQKPPFDEVLVRQALSHAIDKQAIIDLALGGHGKPAFAPLPPSLPGFDPGLQEYELGYDLDAARALLVEAGFQQNADGAWERDGQVLQATLLTSTRSPNDAVATVIQSQLAALGVPVEIQQLDSTAVMKATAEGTFDLLLWRYGWSDADALNIFLHSSRIGSTNRVAYSNPGVDALLDQAVAELDSAKRYAMYVEAQKLIMQDAPWQPLYVPEDVIAFGPKISGARVVAQGRVLLNDAIVTRR